MLKNPLTKYKEREMPKPGIHRAKFSELKTVEVTDTDPANPTGKKTKIVFVFDSLEERDAEITIWANTTWGPKSTFFKTLVSLGGPIPDFVAKNMDKLWELANSLVGKHYTLNVTLSDDGRYVNVIGIMPLTDKEVERSRIEKLADDEIPY